MDAVPDESEPKIRDSDRSLEKPPSGRGKSYNDHWARRYARFLLLTDSIIVLVTVFGSQALWFGANASQLAIGSNSDVFRLSYFLVSVILVLAWLASLAAFDTRDPRVVGLGAMEYKRVFDSGLRLFGLVAIIALLFKVDLARGYILTAFPAGVILLIGTRWLWRQWLIKKRIAGSYSAQALLVGSLTSVRTVADQLALFPHAGFRAVGMCVPSNDASGGHPQYPDIPIVGAISDVADAAKRIGASIVILTSTDSLPPRVVRRISWSLERSGIDLAMAASITDIAGPRIHTRPLAGLPLIHLEVPRYQGGMLWGKTIFDVLGASLAIILLSPLLLAIAIVIKITDRGPVFFRQVRVGLNGKEFRIFKFRTMVIDAEDLLLGLVADNEGKGLLFKLKDDPRITRVGRLLRRFSFDELPQFFNVLNGTMSVVGPRPPLPSEVAKYEPDVRRRLLVKPGITGPWQISGRSDLSWEEGVRLDLYYVENWTLVGDLMLIWRTIKAVVVQRGAY